MKTRGAQAGHLPMKLIACALIVVCLVLGVVGLVLPIIPGLLFLLIAAIVAAKHFPSIERRLRRHRTLGGHLDRADAFSSLELADKLRVGGLLCAKVLLDGLSYAAAAFGRLVRPARRRYP